MSSREIIRLLKKDGWHETRIKGSHHQFKHPLKSGVVTVPHPKKDLPVGTAWAILKSAGINKP
jgi:predicted RNA binding protein YcfA (HicA-like mRNA interferase family)